MIGGDQAIAPVYLQGKSHVKFWLAWLSSPTVPNSFPVIGWFRGLFPGSANVSLSMLVQISVLPYFGFAKCFISQADMYAVHIVLNFRELLRLFISVLVLGRTRTSFSHLGLFRLLFLNVEFTPLSQHTESLFICFGGGMYCHWSISEGGDISRNSWRKLYKNPAKINP